MTAVETPAGNPAPTTLTPNQPYFILGAFLTEVPGIDPKSDPKITFTVDFDGGESIPAAYPQSSVVGFTPTQPMSKATPATIVAHITTGKAPNQNTTKQNIVTTGTAFTVAELSSPSNTPQVNGIFDSQNTKMTGDLTVGQTYKVSGTNLLGGHAASGVTVEVVGSTPQALSLVGTPTDSYISFKVDHAFSSKPVTIMAGGTKLAATARISAN